MARIINPKAISGGYKTLRNSLGGNAELAKIKKVDKWQALDKALNKADYKSKGTSGNVKKLIGDIMKGRVEGLNRDDAMRIAKGLTGGKYTITAESVKPPRVEQILSKKNEKPVARGSPIIDRVMDNMRNKRNAPSVASASSATQSNSFSRPNMGNIVRSQRSIGAIGISARPSGMTKK